MRHGWSAASFRCSPLSSWVAGLAGVALCLAANGSWARAEPQRASVVHQGTRAGQASHDELRRLPTRQRMASSVSAQRKASAQRSTTSPGKATTRNTIQHARVVPGALHGPSPEARLLEIYRLVGAAKLDDALDRATALVNDVPTFQLAQLTYADLLMARAGPLAGMGAGVGEPRSEAHTERLNQLRDEASRRLTGLRERPPTGALPRQFIELPRVTKHAIAVDASRSRLYLFENATDGPRLIRDYYVSLGRLGMDKTTVGDQRTPLGVYFITNRLEASQLTDFYGTGALPLNYPNEYDRRQGKTGSGIWLHGVPSDSYARSPHSTDGCVALANEDLLRILNEVRPRSTPVVIAQRLEWVKPQDLEAERVLLRSVLEGWRSARVSGDLQRALSFYAPGSAMQASGTTDWARLVQRDISAIRGRPVEIKDLSILTWTDKTPLMVVTFGEVISGERTGPVKRQYWMKENGLWKIFYEGVIG